MSVATPYNFDDFYLCMYKYPLLAVMFVATPCNCNFDDLYPCTLHVHSSGRDI